MNWIPVAVFPVAVMAFAGFWPLLFGGCDLPERPEAPTTRREGMSPIDPRQVPADLKEPAMDAGQPAAPRGEIVGYEVAGKFYHPADVTIIRAGP